MCTVLGGLNPNLCRQVKDLPVNIAFRTDPTKILAAWTRPLKVVVDNVVGVCDFLQRTALMALLPTGFAPVLPFARLLLALRVGVMLVRRGRLAAVAAILLQGRNLGFQLLYAIK